MPVECRAVDKTYLDNAPHREVNSVVLNGTPAQIFALFEDADAWPKWYKGMDKVEWTSPKPYGVGTTRTVQLGPLKVYEYFFRWQDNARFSFYFTGTNIPFVKALAEDYLLEPIDEHTTRFTYTVAFEPRLPISALGPLGRAFLGFTFKRASKSLVKYMKKLNG